MQMTWYNESTTNSDAIDAQRSALTAIAKCVALSGWCVYMLMGGQCLKDSPRELDHLTSPHVDTKMTDKCSCNHLRNSNSTVILLALYLPVIYP